LLIFGLVAVNARSLYNCLKNVIKVIMTALTATGDKTVHLIIDSPPNRDDQMSATSNKVLKVIAVILIILGISLIVGGSVFFGLGAAAGAGVIAAGISAVMLASAPAMIPLGLTTLLSGCNLLAAADKGSKNPKPTFTDLLVNKR
jgi:hypothetical protein